MATTTLGPDHYLELEYEVPSGRLVEFEIDADRPVRSYVLSKRERDRFVQGKRDFEYFGGFPLPRSYQQQKLELPFSGWWYLVISNPSKDHSAKVRYDVFF